MHGGYSAGKAVGHQDRSTVRGANGNRDVRRVRNERVRFRLLFRNGSPAANDGDRGAVDLSQRGNTFSANRTSELAVVGG